MDDWVSITCPLCNAKLRIKGEHAHLRGKCPKCGFRLAAPRPQPGGAGPTRPISTSDEPRGLAPLDPEWPEAPRVDPDEEPPSYGIGVPPPTWSEPKPEPLPSGEVYQFIEPDPAKPPPLPAAPVGFAHEVVLQDDSPPPIRRPAAARPAPATARPVLPPDPGLPRLSNAEENPEVASPPPAFPFWQGTYSFPFRLRCLPPLIWLTIGFTFIAGISSGLLVLGGFVAYHWLGDVDVVQRMVVIAMVGFMTALVWITAWTGGYGTVHFLAIIEDTAAGNDDVKWPEGTWREFIARLCYILWILLCSSMLPAAVLWAIGLSIPNVPDVVIRAPLTAIAASVFFPIFLLCSLAAGSFWTVIHPPVLGQLLRKPLVLLQLYLHTFILLFPCLILWIVTVLGFSVAFAPALGFLVSPFLGFALAASVLIYGRILGRVGWFLNAEEETPRRRRRRRAPRVDAVS